MFLAAALTPETNHLFTGMSKPQVEALLKSGKNRQFKRGQALFLQGDPILYFYIVVSGVIQFYRTTADGHEKTIHLLKDGQPMCESEIMDGCRNHRVSAKAVEEVSVIEFPAQWLKDAAKQYPEFALNLLSLLAQEAHLAEIEAEHQATMSAAQLVACFLQRICVLYDFNPKSFTLPYPKSLIASRLGMELETFSRTLAKLKENGITVSGNTVSITDLKQIESYVCGLCSIADDCSMQQALEIKYGETK